MKQSEIEKIAHINNMEFEIFCRKNKIKTHEKRIENLNLHIKMVKDSKEY